MHEIIQKLLTYLRSMWRYRWYAMALTWIIVSIGWYKVYQLPDVYQVSTSVHVNTDSILRPLLQGLAIEPDVAQRLRLLSRTLKSRTNMEKLAQMSELEINKDASSEKKISVDDLRSKIQLTVSERAENIYSISYENTDPYLAKVVVENLLKIIKENTLNQADDGAHNAKKFLEQQTANYQQKLRDAEERLEKFKRKNAALVPAIGQGYFVNLQSVRESLANAELELNEAIKRRDEIKRQMSGQEPVFGIIESDNNANITHPLDSQIQELQKQLNELLLQYTELHPKVITLKESIERLERQKRREIASQPKVNSMLPGSKSNPIYQQLSVTLSEAEAQVASLRVRVNEYKKREKNLQEMVDTMPAFEAEMNSLSREVEVQQQNYREMLERQQTAVFSSEVEQTGGTIEFEVLEPPRVPRAPSGPNRLWFNSIILAVGIAAGLGLAFLISEIKPVIYESEVLRNITGLPVFGVVSLMVTDESKKKERIEYGGYSSAFMLLITTFVLTSFL